MYLFENKLTRKVHGSLFLKNENLNGNVSLHIILNINLLNINQTCGM